MNKENLDNYKYNFKQLSYEDKRSFYFCNFSTGTFVSKKLSNKLALLSLLCLLTKKLREKEGGLTVKSVIEKILQRPLLNEHGFDSFLISISIICEDLLFGVEEIDNFGFTDSKQVVNKIKELLNEWLPF